jgi:hypothetical protein
LRQLDRCDDNLLYDSLIDKILDWCAELCDAGQREEIYRALLILTERAGADLLRGERPRALMAQAALEQLVDRPQLEFLIARACDGEVAGVRPTQVLLQLGEGSTEALPDGRGDADLRELKCATLEVLGGHDGSEAQTLILSATRDDDPAVSRKAHEIMNQRDRAQSN